VATFLPLAVTMMRSKVSWDIALGRWLALCVHPICTWRLRSARARALIVTSYFAVSYIGALAMLAMLGR
jgi:hypothetical protein